jgi:hypothetical protein
MEDTIKKLCHSHWRYDPRETTWPIFLPDGSKQLVDSSFVKEVIVGKFKELKKQYDKLWAVEREAILAGKHHKAAEVRDIRLYQDQKAKIWLDKWDRLVSERPVLDAKDIKYGLTAEKVLQWYGVEIKNKTAKCIAHADTHPSMHVYTDGVHCFSCGYHGDVIDMVMRLENTDFKSALTKIAELK